MKWTDPSYPPGWEIDVCRYLDYVGCLVPEEETLAFLSNPKWNNPPIQEIPEHWVQARKEYQEFFTKTFENLQRG